MSITMMGSGVIEAWEDFDLKLSLEASFSFPMFEMRGRDSFVKTYGHRSGMRLEGYVGIVRYEGCSFEEALYMSGAWFDPLENASRLKRKKAAYIYELWQAFPGLGIAVDPWDLRAMFYAMFLSRNTGYHSNTVRWMKIMFSRARNEGELASLDPGDFGSSYQLAQLSEVKPHLDEVLASLTPGLELMGSEGTFSSAKTRLLALPHIGPKTVHAFALFCFGLTRFAPADRHLLAVSKALGLAGDDVRMPRKELCMRYDCWSGQKRCPQAPRCLTAILMRELGHMAGWFQTVCFLYGSLYLRKGQDPIGLLKR